MGLRAAVFTYVVFAASPVSSFQECGIRYAVNRHKPVISHGFEAEHSEYPWHVALYRQYSPTQEPEYICGGSIIHHFLILTAAHCVYNENAFGVDRAVFSVVAGKHNRSWYQGSAVEQVFKVTDARVPTTYLGLPNRYADDIAILAINDSIKFSSVVMPVCIDWSSDLNVNQTAIPGTVVGWGYNHKGALSDGLSVAKLNYFNFTTCRIRAEDSGFSSFVTSDKFCAGVDNGTAVEKGDSGGGFVVPRNSTENIEKYYLYGIVSTKDTWTNRTAAFTDLNVHLDWINSTIESIKKLGFCTALASPFVELTLCSNNGTSVGCNEPAIPGTKAKIRCKDSFHDWAPYKLHTGTQCFENRTWSPMTDLCITCGITYIANDEVYHLVSTKSNESEALKKRPEPWHVGIYKKSDKMEYICGGAIIHPKAVLTAAQCVHGLKPESFYVVVGKRECSWNTTETHEQRFEVSKIFIKDTYKGREGNSSYMDDIAILELNNTVLFNDYVMPTCIDWSKKLRLYKNPLISGMSMGCGQGDKELSVHKLRFLNWKRCSAITPEPGLAPDKICATSEYGINILKEGYTGGAFTFPKYNEKNGDQTNYLYGIITYKADDNVVRFTSVIYHLKWIKKIILSKIIKS